MMKNFCSFFLFLLTVVMMGCDLQPKIASIPDSVGEFISERYPTLLAEPDSEIYKTAVADYGIYASPTVYGDGDVTGDDYVLYSSADDYLMPNQSTDDEPDVQANYGTEPEEEPEVITDDASDSDDDTTDNTDDEEYTPDNNVDDLIIPDWVNEKPVPVENKKIEQQSKSVEKVDDKKDVKSDETPEMVRADLREIVVAKGDTLYSLSRKYAVPVNDLAVMNKISAPFALAVGQKLKVPDVLSVPVRLNLDSAARAATKNNTVDKKADVKADSKKVVEAKKSVKPDEKVNVKKEPDTAKKQEKKLEKNVDVKKDSKSIDTKKTDAAPVKPKNTKIEQSVKTVKTKAEQKVPAAKTVDKKATVKSEPKKEVKKTDVKNTAAKKTEVKKETKKTDTKKTEPKKTTKQNTTKQSRNTKSGKIVARSSSKFSWPVRGKILSGYGSKSNGLFNDGINIKATRGTNVVAAENGLVAYAGNEVKGMGNLIIIQHSDGWMTVYAHMNSMSVRRGHQVSVGQKIGTVGSSGKVDQPQLHFEIRKGTRAYNPVSYLKK